MGISYSGHRFLLGIYLSAVAVIAGFNVEPAYAQVLDGNTTGKVSDSTGTMIPDAPAAAVTHQEISAVLSGEANTSDEYPFLMLAAGNHTSIIRLDGSRKYRESDVIFGANDAVRVDVASQMGEVAETDEVSAIAARLQTTSSGTLAESAAERFGGASSRPPLFKSMAQGQSPDSLFITCSDSRLIPSVITQTGIGELFVIRNAGNIVPPYAPRPEGVTATIEYAVAVLEVPSIIVCGHTLCGAMKAALEPDGLDTVPSVRDWIQYVAPARLAVDELHPLLDPDARWLELVKQNVLQQLRNLKTHPWVAARTATGRLRLEGWVYELESKRVLRLLPLP
ncbi:MAG: hypothetical protein OXB98_12795 [Bryobacterales bacterium]|nr:hypothetical protein [Bryobacterales bacterium]